TINLPRHYRKADGSGGRFENVWQDRRCRYDSWPPQALSRRDGRRKSTAPAGRSLTKGKRDPPDRGFCATAYAYSTRSAASLPQTMLITAAPSVMSNTSKERRGRNFLTHWGWGRERCPSAKDTQTLL